MIRPGTVLNGVPEEAEQRQHTAMIRPSAQPEFRVLFEGPIVPCDGKRVDTNNREPKAQKAEQVTKSSDGDNCLISPFGRD